MVAENAASQYNAPSCNARITHAILTQHSTLNPNSEIANPKSYATYHRRMPA